MIKLSVVIIALNEEDKIENCLRSVSQVADEIVVVDSFSTDGTRGICEKYKSRFIQQKFLGYIEQKNFALDLASHDYILSLDADEMLSDELIASIKKVKLDWQGDGYEFNRLNNHSGKWIRHCGWYPDKKLRLIRKNTARWGGDNPHDILIPEENREVNWIKGDLLHFSFASISDHLRQANHFTTISAKTHYEAGIRVGRFKSLYRAIWQFFRDYFLKRGFLDGRIGLIVCAINSLAYFLKFEKIYELQNKKSN